MFGSIVTRAAIMLLGYLYPAYDCYKSLERGRPQIDQLRFWCQYWIIIALITVSERIADPLVSWLPFYCEAKLAFIVYLWHPSTKGTAYIYSQILLPVVARHEPEIDRHLADLRTRSSDAVVHYVRVFVKTGQDWVLEAMRYLAAQAPQNQIEGSNVSRAQAAAPHQSRGVFSPWGDDTRGGRRTPPPYRVVVQEEDDSDDFDVVEPVTDSQRQQFKDASPNVPRTKPAKGTSEADPSRDAYETDFDGIRYRPDDVPTSFPAAPVPPPEEYVTKLRSRAQAPRSRASRRSGSSTDTEPGSRGARGTGGSGSWGR